MTSQEVFDKVVVHLRKQGRQAVKDGCCLYRSPEGLKCAVGCLIEDAEYSPAFERKILCDLIQYLRYLESLEGTDRSALLNRLVMNEPLLERLQSVHDDGEVPDWEQGLARVAKEFDLTMPTKETGT